MYSNFNQQQQQQQQQLSFASQQTGRLPPQLTGYPTNLQPQYTAYPQQPPPQQQPPPIPHSQHHLYPQYQFQPSAPQQQLPQQYSQSPSHVPSLASQPTGMTSAQMADSFRSTASQSQPTTSQPSRATTSKIPSIRLSFITASDQAKFEQLFRSAVGTGQAMTGVQARELLMRSKLTGDALARIWTLADTTKSGQLLFPEFALAMYLCNLRLNGKDIPSSLPDRVKNEVSSMVDIISFGIPDDKPQPPIRATMPNFFDSGDSSKSPTALHQPQPQQSNAQILASMNSHPTGMPIQMTGYSSQMAGLPLQQTGGQPQQNNFLSTSQSTGYNGPRPPMPPIPTMPTGYGATPITPLNAQPTGIPGQWGLVNTPATGLPNIDALHRQMMPQSGNEGGYTTAGLSGNATIPWAVTKDEKKIYDDIFRAWDGFGKGFVSGDQAIEIFGQSGLNKADLERIWTLSDPNNKGRLNLDEFAVAMHLIYRKLNGYPVPNQLPPELTPPSTRNLNDTIGTVKSMLSRDAEQRKNTGAFLQPQRTGISYLKSHSFRQGSPLHNKADGTIFKNNDDHVGYRSSARRRVGNDGRSPSPAVSGSSDDVSAEDIRKLIREKQILLDAVDFRDESQAEDDQMLDQRDRRDAEELFRRIRVIQENIDNHPSALESSVESSVTERRQLGRHLQTLNDRLPDLASQVRKCERAIADAQLELFRIQNAKSHPSAAPVIGTGPGGQITESDRIRARAKALMQQRSAALTGKQIPVSTDDSAAAIQRFDAESTRIKGEKEKNERMVQDVEESVSSFGKALEESLKEGASNSTAEHERTRWRDALGVEIEVRDFIFELQRQSQSTKMRSPEDTVLPSRREQTVPPAAGLSGSSVPVASSTTPSFAGAGGSSHASYRTAEERTAYIKQQAEQRMAERLAALGIRPTKAGETAQQRAERDRKEQEARLRKAEEEDVQREQERQRRLAEEQILPPTAVKSAKKPPPPPSRKTGSAAQTLLVSMDNQLTETNKNKQDIEREQEAQETKIQQLEDEEQLQEQQLVREKEAQDARLKALEEQVRQGKIRKEEEKKRRRQEQKATKEREAKLAVHKAEIDAARERERQLRLQLDGLGNDSSSEDEGPQQITPQGTTPAASQELPQVDVAASESHMPDPPPSGAANNTPPHKHSDDDKTSTVSPLTESETKNPFLKKMQAATGSVPPAPALPSLSKPTESMNPFHKLTAQQDTRSLQEDVPVSSGRARQARVKDDDDWSVVEEDSSDEDDAPIGGGAKQLASLLFGTMGPPRPLSSMEIKDATGAPPHSKGVVSSPPSAPPLPGNAPPPPLATSSGAPPPPPMPSGVPPIASKIGGGAPDISNLLGAIKQGTGLRKVETKDRSASSVAGRVLG